MDFKIGSLYAQPDAPDAKSPFLSTARAGRVAGERSRDWSRHPQGSPRHVLGSQEKILWAFQFIFLGLVAIAALCAHANAQS